MANILTAVKKYSEMKLCKITSLGGELELNKAKVIITIHDIYLSFITCVINYKERKPNLI